VCELLHMIEPRRIRGRQAHADIGRRRRDNSRPMTKRTRPQVLALLKEYRVALGRSEHGHHSFGRARDQAAFCPRDPPSPAAETESAAPACANVAESRGFFGRPQETGFARNQAVMNGTVV
jgi:hypothetical protein